MTKIKLGPLLGLEGDDLYTICILTDTDSTSLKARVGNKEITFDKITKTINNNFFWRCEFKIPIPTTARYYKYNIIDNANDVLINAINESNWTFYVPSKEEKIKIAYSSCNGFSSKDLRMKADYPFVMRKTLIGEHYPESPFSLAIMGGDQVYADQIWDNSLAPSVKGWSISDKKDRLEWIPPNKTKSEVEKFYENLYIEKWNQKEMAQILATIPTIMMWDDHDIFDGWGSYDKDIQNCDMYKTIFAAAKKYFELFQIRTEKNSTLLNKSDKKNHYSFVVEFRDYKILGLDNRSERTRKEIMSESNWKDVKTFLKNGQSSTTLVLTAVPLLYRDIKAAEEAISITPWQEEVTDDLIDHWQSKYHNGERLKLIYNLFDFKNKSEKNTLILLSGDVHVGYAGIFFDKRDPDRKSMMHQIVSSAMVHPPPTFIQWQGIMLFSNDDKKDFEDNQFSSEFTKLYNTNDLFLRTRNFATLQKGTDSKIWVNWFCENFEIPALSISDS